MTFNVPNRSRVRHGIFATTEAYGNNGVFLLQLPKQLQTPILEIGMHLQIIAGDGDGWEHVSASLPHRCPTWEEMCFVKDVFWGVDDCVVQFHPPHAEYVNNHQFCLHLWRRVGGDFEMPPAHLIGIRTFGVLK